jgi:hypothetical protein
MGKIWNRIVALLAIMVCVHVGAAAQDASNIDFSNRFEGWTREIVYFKHVPKVDPTDPNENDSYAFRYETMADDDDRITIMGTTEDVNDRKWNDGKVIDTKHRFTEEEKAYDIHYDLQQMR